MSRRRGGHCAKHGFDPVVIAAYLDARSVYRRGGQPQRKRRYINGKTVHPHDARMLRRWRSGTLASASVPAVAAMLAHYDLTPADLVAWADDHFLNAVTHGNPLHPYQEAA